MRALLVPAVLFALTALDAPLLRAVDEPARLKAKEELRALSAELGRLPRAFNLVHEVAGPSVVAIHTKVETPVLRRGMFGAVHTGRTQEIEVGEGSGFAIARDGESTYLLTNAHVVLRMDEGREFSRDRRGEYVKYDRLTAETNDGRMVDAEYVGWYVETDLAVLKIPVALPPVDWADSDQVKVGDWVVALGYPMGIGYSATSGIVSAIGRSTGIYRGVGDGGGGFEAFIQTDAAINRGNSGGPLVGLDGHIVGVNASILSPTGTSMGLGFAIPANVTKRVSDDLIAHGRVRRPAIGVNVGEIAGEAAAKQGLPPAAAVAVVDVVPGSPAELGGLRPGDVVLAIDGVAVSNDQQFRSRLLTSRVGRPITVSVQRSGQSKELRVTPIEWEELSKLVRSQAVDLPGYGLRLAADRRGIFVAAVEPDSLAAQAGIEPMDRIESERKSGPLKTLDDVHELEKRPELVLLVRKGTQGYWITLRLGR